MTPKPKKPKKPKPTKKELKQIKEINEDYYFERLYAAQLRAGIRAEA